jgi:hypothetical protein
MTNKRGCGRKKCFWYMHGKCSRDHENIVAVKPCLYKCQYFILPEKMFNGLKEKDYD